MSSYIAKPFIAGTPEAEVTGEAMSAFLDNLEADTLRPILEKHGLTEIETDKWYPHQIWMDVLKDVNDNAKGGASSIFVAFGRKVVETAVMPPEIQTIEDVLNSLHAIHHANLRNIPDDEGYKIEKIKPKHYLVYHNTPNPLDAIYGFLWGLVARYKKPNEVFVVKPVENPDPDKFPGDVFSVRWGNTVEEIRS